METPQTLLEAVRYFSDLDVCQQYMADIRWPEGKPICPKCGCDRTSYLTTQRRYKCMAKECHKQFSPKVGTIFEDSPLPLSSWFVAIWLIANAKNGISSCELARALGTRQATAWFMLHRIRLAMETGSFKKLENVVESDETFIGGKAANMHKHVRERKIRGRGTVGKTVVHGLLERGNADAETTSKVIAKVVPNTEAETLMPEILRNVERTAVVCTDAAAAYAGLASGFIHHAIDHATAYVRSRVHVNGIENFWALLKRMLGGTYVAVAPFHLHRYVTEEVFRFNERDQNDGRRFAKTIAGVFGKRVTLRELCAIGDAGFMGLK